MAVEIPVVIDIDAAFAAAAKRVPAAMAPLKKAIGGVEEDLADYTGMLKLFDIDSKEFQTAAKEIQNISQHLEVASDKFMKFSTNEGSIKRLNAELQSLNRRWAEMGSAQKYTPSGALSADAQALKNDYIRVTQEIQKSAKSLQQIEQEERRIDEIKKRGIQSRRYENAILNSTVKTMRILQEQERILSDRLSRAKIGSNKYEVLKSQLTSVRTELNKINGKGFERVNAEASKTSNVMRQLTSYAASFVSVWSAVSFIKRIRETTAEFELQEVALGGILQDTAKAHSLFQQIKAAAVESPFFVKDLVTYTKQLSAYRIETDKLFDVTMQLADVSAGLGVDMNRLILAYGQVRAASVLRGQELRQFTEAGVPLVELLADKFTELRGTMVSTADVFKLISERAVPFRMIEEIFNDMTSAGGMFYKMQEKQAKTLSGRWNNLKDSIAIAMDEAGRTEEMQELFDSMIALAKSFVKYLPVIVKAAKDIAVGFLLWNVRARALAVTQGKLTTSIVKTRVEALRTIATSKGGVNAMNNTSRAANLLYARMGILRKGILNVRMALKALLKTALANPFGAIIAGVTAVASAFDLWGDETEENEGIADIGAFIANAEKRHKEMNELADTYDKLSAKQELNERQQKQLVAVTNELAKAYNGKAIEIDNATGKIKINTDEIRKLSEAEKEERKIQLQAQKERIEGYNKSNEARRKYLVTELKFKNDPELLALDVNTRAEKLQQAYADAGLTSEDLKKIRNWLTDDYDILTELNRVTEWLDTGAEQLKEIEEAFNKLSPNDDRLNGWQRAIMGVQEEYENTGNIFSRLTEEQLENFSTLHDALLQFAKDWRDWNKQIKTSEDSLKSLQSQYKALDILDTWTDEAAIKDSYLYNSIKDVKKELALNQANKEFFEMIFALFGVDPKELLKKANGGHTAYTQPAYIANMNEQLKFMKDFEKGYKDLEKYMGKANALSEEFANMSARGLALGLGEEEQKRAAEGLSDWYKDVLDKTAEEMRKKTGLRGSVQELLSYQITGSSDRDKMIRDFQKLLQQIFDARTDFNTKHFEDGIKRALKIAADKISRSEEARNFYNDILSLTGDVELAAQISFGLYGGSGEELEDRINNALADILRETEIVKDTNLFGLLMGTFKSRDMVAFNKALDDLGDEYSEVVEQLRDLSSEYTKFYKTQTTDLLKALEAAKTYGEERVKIERDTMRREEQINGLKDVSEEKKEQLRLRNRKKAAEEVAKAEYEVFKNSPMYVQMFSDLDGASTRMLENMRDRLISVQAYWKDLSATELKELQARLTEIDNALANRNPFRAFSRALQERSDVISTGAGSRKADEERARIARAKADEQVRLLDAMLDELDALKKEHGTESDIVKSKEKEVDVQQQETDAAIEAANAAEKQALKWNDVVNAIDKAVEGITNYADQINEIVDSTQKIFDVFASQENSDIFGNYAQGLKDLTSGASNIAKGLTGILTGTDVFGGSVKLLSGIADVVSGIWGTSSRERIRKADKDIKEQQRLIDNLKESYDRLGDAMAKSFGSDYIYNFQTQLKLLEAQVAAYRKQAEAERGKGKKADADAVREYEKSAREVEQQIKDMRSGLSSFFTGTDVTSAAKDFASAWLDAYRSFSSTTGAMKEKFQDLVQEMVTNSLAAQMVQSILGPWFEQIDNMAKSGGILDANEISQIAAETGGYVDVINAALTNLMNDLAGAGLNMRENAGSLTGIKRELSGATEETMSAVAVGLNTQNFYMSFVPTIGADVAAIREALTGESSVTRSSVNVSSSGFGDDVFRGQMSRIDENIMEIRALLKSVISPRGTTASTHSVSVKY